MNDIIVVSGQGRCGTSLLMQMFEQSGIGIVANAAGYEDSRFVKRKDLNWLIEAKGKAIKILDIYKFNLPSTFQYKVIWLRRDYFQQAKSWNKFMKKFAPKKISNHHFNNVLRALPILEQLSYKMLGNNKISFIVIQFEDLLKQPIKCLQSISSFLNIDFDIKAMTDVIIERQVECLSNVDIELFHVENYKLSKQLSKQ